MYTKKLFHLLSFLARILSPYIGTRSRCIFRVVITRAHITNQFLSRLSIIFFSRCLLCTLLWNKYCSRTWIQIFLFFLRKVTQWENSMHFLEHMYHVGRTETVIINGVHKTNKYWGDKKYFICHTDIFRVSSIYFFPLDYLHQQLNTTRA